MSEDTPDPDDLRDRIEALADRLDEATAEEEYVAIEADIEALEADLDALDEAIDDEDDEVPTDEIAEELEGVAETLEAERGPYTEDVTAILESVASTIEDAEWTDTGHETVHTSISVFLDEEIDAFPDLEVPSDSAGMADVIRSVGAELDDAGLDPDEDAAVIEAALLAAETLQETIDGAETWGDLSIREKLEAKGFYDILDHRKDYPPEWSALKAHEQAGNVDKILLALEHLDSAFMKENCLESLKRLGSPQATEAMMQLAQRRDRDAIEVLGRIGDDEPVEMLCEYIVDGANRPLELTIIESLGRIGSTEATQTLADRLEAEDALIRSTAARALGMIGDTRAIEPLSTTLENDEAGNVRGSAAWALNEIGTEQALSIASEYAEDGEYLVEVQGSRARTLLEAAEQPA